MKSCKEIAKLLSPNQKISLWGKIEIRMHMLICKMCRDYQKQIGYLKKKYTENFNQKVELNAEKIKSLEDKIIHDHKKSS